MLVKSLQLINFKKFRRHSFDFNDDINIFVGDNDAGKSTLLEALEMALSFCHRGRPLSAEFSPDLFNGEAIQTYLESDKSIEHLPELIIEAYIDGVAEFRGINNSRGEDTEGIIVRAYFDHDLAKTYTDHIAKAPKISSIPIEYYKLEWLDFSWNTIKSISKPFRALYIDPTRLHPTTGKNQYISSILNTALEKQELAKLMLNYRETQQSFNDSAEVIGINKGLDKDHLITTKSLSIAANSLPTGAIQSGFQLEVDNVPFHFIGKGEQSNVQIKLAIQNKSKDVDLVMMEEPENHLSHINLSRLISYIEEQRGDKQLFLTTHSSYVLNKLSIDKICLLQSGYKRLKDLDKSVVKTLKRLPGYDTLRVALSNKIILVEGPSDELILKKIYLRKKNRLPEEDGIDIIVVRGVGFQTFVEIGKEIGAKVHVLRDNDGNYKKNIVQSQAQYKDFPNIKLFSSQNNDEFSLEPSLIFANAINEDALDSFAKLSLSTKTFKIYDEKESLEEKKQFLISWFGSVEGDGRGKIKVDSAIRLFESDQEFKYPEFLDEVLNFD